MSEESDGGFSLKVSLGRLLPSPAMRDQLERTAETMQILLMRATLLASTVAIEAMAQGRPCPPIDTQTWWRQCIASCGRLARSAAPTSSTPEMRDAAQKLFGGFAPGSGHALVHYDYMWPFLSTQVRELQAAATRMIASTFHAQLDKAFKREIALYEAEVEKLPSMDARCRYHLRKACMRCATGHRDQMPFPEECPPRLRQRLDGLISSWHSRFSQLLPCPSWHFISSGGPSLPRFAEWLFALQVHRRTCIERMQEVRSQGAPPPPRGQMARAMRPESPLEDAMRAFPKGSCQAQPIFPLAGSHVRHINVDPSSLLSLFNACMDRGENPTRQPSAPAKLQEKTAGEDVFIACFPGLEAMKKRRRYQSGAGVFSFRSFKTDGVSASLFFEREAPKKRKRKEDFHADPFEEDEERLRRELRAQSLPAFDIAAHRLVTIDPGRRDPIAAIIDDDGLQSKFKVPAWDFNRRCRRGAHARLTERVLKEAKTDDGRRLWDVVLAFPTRRDVNEWEPFALAYASVIDDLARAKRAKKLRRAAFDAYVTKDRVIDQILRELCGGSLGPKARERTIIAMGAAAKTCCSSGFGHAPVAMSRFLRRIRTLGICLVFVDEFRTSRICSNCLDTELDSVRMKDAQGVSKVSWQLKKCRKCCNPTATGPKVWQRDYNAALNIRTCFLSLFHSERPPALCRGGPCERVRPSGHQPRTVEPPSQ